MIFAIYLCWFAGGAVGSELDVLYEDCSRYETDSFGGPVCGSDGRTYRNPVHLSCVNHHRRRNRSPDIVIGSHGSCPGDYEGTDCPWNPLYKPVCGGDGQTYTNKEWLSCRNNKNTTEEVEIMRPGECEPQEPCSVEHKRGPRVCATNGLTYPSAEVVRCLSLHHADLEISHEGGCTVEEVQKLYPTRTRVCEVSKHHHEYNPICGPRNKTYGNPFIFLCSNPLAGSAQSGGCCESNILNACRRAIQLDRKYEECKKNTHFAEVCGTDGLTYRSIDHLICAGRNNSQLLKLHEGPCTLQDSPCLRCKEMEGEVPVCGTDGLTYSSFAALSCVARSRDPSLRFVHVGVCVKRKNTGCYGIDCN